MSRKSYVPQEVELFYIIPAIRREFVKAMMKKGLSQRAAARNLGLTDAAVSNYLKDKRARQVQFSGAVKEEIKKSADRILEGGSVIRETERVVDLTKKTFLLCRISHKLGYAPKGCRECFK